MIDPAASIVSKLGGPSKVSEIAGVHRTRVSNWMRAKEVGGTGGIIPLKHIPALISYAAEHGIPLTADEFLPKGAAA